MQNVSILPHVPPPKNQPSAHVSKGPAPNQHTLANSEEKKRETLPVAEGLFPGCGGMAKK